VRPVLTKDILTSFLEHGKVRDEPLAYVPMNFDVGMGFPTIAKLVLGGTVLVASLIILGLVLIIRRVRRKLRSS
jgi:hypothetical protein